MNVTSGSEWLLPSGNKRYIEIGLNDDDGMILVPGWEDLSWNERMDNLQKRADAEVLKYIFRDGGINEEFYRQRLEVIRAR